MEEIWKDIKGYEGYQVSNLGRVRSLGNKTHTTIHFLKLKLNEGYFQVALCKNGKHKYYFVHRLVYEAFVGEIPKGMQCNHIDEKPNNNRLENLNLMTPKENTNWGTHNIRCSKSLINNPKICKPVLQYDLEGNFIKEWPSAAEIKRELGFLNTSISSCCKKKPRYKTAYGYIWKYKEKAA